MYILKAILSASNFVCYFKGQNIWKPEFRPVSNLDDIGNRTILKPDLFTQFEYIFYSYDEKITFGQKTGNSNGVVFLVFYITPRNKTFWICILWFSWNILFSYEQDKKAPCGNVTMWVSIWSAKKSAKVIIIENSQMAITYTKFWNFSTLKNNCCVFQPANGCSACCLLVEIISFCFLC